MPKLALIRQYFQRFMQHNAFDSHLKKVKFLTANSEGSTAVLTVEQEHTNLMGGLHGGLSATLVDVLSSLSLLTHERGEGPSVSVNLNMTYLKGANVGDEILIESKIIRVGKTLAFLEVDIRDNKSKDLLVQGKHTKYLLGA